MVSKGRYKQAERLLRKMAKTNKRTFDEKAFQQLKDEQEKVNYKTTSSHKSRRNDRDSCTLDLSLSVGAAQVPGAGLKLRSLCGCAVTCG